MKQSYRLLPLFLTVLMIVGIFAACSPPADKPESSAIESSGSSEEVSEAESAAAEDLKATVEVWTWEPQENQQEIIDDFNEVYPDIKIEFTTVASADMPMKIQTALASDSDLPDVVWCEISNRGRIGSAAGAERDSARLSSQSRNTVAGNARQQPGITPGTNGA